MGAAVAGDAANSTAAASDVGTRDFRRRNTDVNTEMRI